VALADSIERRLFSVYVKVNLVLYRATNGRVTGSHGGAPVLLLTTTGRRSGKRRTTPLLYLEDGGGTLVVVASYGGAPKHPAWYLNLSANPDVEVQIGREIEPRRARTADEDERARLWPRLVAMYANYATYQTRTEREIPVVILDPLRS
jgi:deazaflavin-dependent oxidoreductase (nitroreductase family)